MPGTFTDIMGKFKTALNNDNLKMRDLMIDRLGEEMDRLDRELRSKTTGQPNTGTPRPIVLIGGGGTSGGGGVTTGGTNEDTFLVAVATGETISTGDVVTVRLSGSGGLEALLANASDSARRADAVVVSSRTVSGVRKLVCASRGPQKIKLASLAQPAIQARLYLSAVSAGRLTDNPSESTSRLFEQEIGLYLGPAKNAMGAIIAGVAEVDVQLPPPASLPVSAV